MGHEKETLEAVTRSRMAVDAARESESPEVIEKAETSLRKNLAGLYAVVENYPDLKADTMFVSLETRISTIETMISDRRELYNEAVNALNVRSETFPDMVIAKLRHFEAAKMLEFTADETAEVDVKKSLI